MLHPWQVTRRVCGSRRLPRLLLVPRREALDLWAPILPPCCLLHFMWLMPDPSSPGDMSPVIAMGGSWSALGPMGSRPLSVMSTSYPHRIQIGSQLSMTSLRQRAYSAV